MQRRRHINTILDKRIILCMRLDEGHGAVCVNGEESSPSASACSMLYDELLDENAGLRGNIGATAELLGRPFGRPNPSAYGLNIAVRRRGTRVRCGEIGED
jgi:hypothetical protein